MKVIIKETYEQLSAIAAIDLVALMKLRQNPLVCTASGDTPAGMYKQLVEKVKEHELDIAGWSFVGLDEWMGMNENTEGSCRYHLNKQLFDHLPINEERISFFDGTKDAEKECERVESFISQHGGIHVAILGLGMNGHIGMNEPGSSPAERSHLTKLDAMTQQVGQKYFQQQQTLSEGITLGLGTLLESDHIFLLVSGAHKAGIVKQLVEGEISAQLPGSLLRNHPSATLYLDKAAASQLQPSVNS